MRGFVDFAYYLRDTFTSGRTSYSSFRFIHESSGYSIISKVLDGKLYIPVFMDNEVLELVRKEGLIRNSDIVCDIPTIFRQVKAATSARILKSFLTYSRRSNFTEVITTKGYRYKGTKGVILDGDYNPLMICCKTYNIVGERIEYRGPICLISPRVFTNTDLVSKFIVKNIIPNIYDIRVDSFKQSVYISYFIDRFVNKPKVPESLDFNDSIYGIINTNLNEIVDESQGILQGLDHSNTL